MGTSCAELTHQTKAMRPDPAIFYFKAQNRLREPSTRNTKTTTLSQDSAVNNEAREHERPTKDSKRRKRKIQGKTGRETGCPRNPIECTVPEFGPGSGHVKDPWEFRCHYVRRCRCRLCQENAEKKVIANGGALTYALPENPVDTEVGSAYFQEEAMASEVSPAYTFMASDERVVASLNPVHVDMDGFEGGGCWRERMELGHM